MRKNHWEEPYLHWWHVVDALIQTSFPAEAAVKNEAYLDKTQSWNSDTPIYNFAPWLLLLAFPHNQPGLHRLPTFGAKCHSSIYNWCEQARAHHPALASLHCFTNLLFVKSINGSAPVYLSELLHPDVQYHSLRSAYVYLHQILGLKRFFYIVFIIFF